MSITAVLRNPRRREIITIYRQGGEWQNGKWEISTKEEISTSAVVVIPNSKDLDQIPQGDRAKGQAVFFTTVPLNISSANTTSDLVKWHDDIYKIDQVFDWSRYGFYKAVGVRIEGT